MHIPWVLGICAFSNVCCAIWKSINCAPFYRMHTHSARFIEYAGNRCACRVHSVGSCNPLFLVPGLTIHPFTAFRGYFPMHIARSLSTFST